MRKLIFLFIVCLFNGVLFGQHTIDKRKYFKYTDTIFEVNKVLVIKRNYDWVCHAPIDYFNPLDSVISFMDYGQQLFFEIGSYTDSKGNDEYNLKLSAARAKSDYNYLVAKGCDSSRLSYRGYGETLPLIKETNVDGSDCEECRQMNRRTEIRITSIDEAFIKN